MGARPLRRLAWPLALAATVFVASGQHHLPTPVEFNHMDKVVHALTFGLMATLTVRAFFRSRHPVRSACIAILCVSAYGVFDELRQSFTPGRTVDVGDWIADTGGAMLAVVLYTLWPWYRRILEWPLWTWARARSGIALQARAAEPAITDR